MLITGQKYIGLTHGNLLARFQWQWTHFPHSAAPECPDTVLAKTAPYFVDSLSEVWAALLGGALLLMPEPHEAVSATRLLELVARHGVHRLVVTPTFLSMLLGADPRLLARASAHIRQLTISGEVLRETLALSCRAVFGSATLVHMYGATETTADVAACFIGEAARPCRIGATSLPPAIDKEPAALAEGCVCSTGWPIAGSIVAIVDTRWHECAPGTTGLVVVGGPLLSPSVESDCVACTLCTGEEHWLWPTGDAGVWTEARGLAVLGRADRVRKFGGQRIALDDVERAMCVPCVKRVAVVTLTAMPGDSGSSFSPDEQLGAMIVPDAPLVRRISYSADELDGGAEAESVRAVFDSAIRNARRLLPPLAVPRVLVAVRALPLLPSAKVDYVTVRASLLERVAPKLSANAEALVDESMRSCADAVHEAFARECARRCEAVTHGETKAHSEAMLMLEGTVRNVWGRYAWRHGCSGIAHAP